MVSREDRHRTRRRPPAGSVSEANRAVRRRRLAKILIAQAKRKGECLQGLTCMIDIPARTRD
ncbi:MAG TPA: hypothetical protein DEA80_03885 [Afipia sp.]|nr:hypothetical protein [Afipia sp.]HAP10955.1 hypothetical protein [Afipia sp.]HAP46079.1 hypothetical protein [Afipia sp.]HAQ92779.1 hypothetical protein [Afipia sp.]HBF56952.1 hypothetical protein [Afipia sp.]